MKQIYQPNVFRKFSKKDNNTLRQFFEFNKKYYSQINEELTITLADHPTWGPILKMQTPEQRQERNKQSLELQRAAIYEDKWEGYCTDLKVQGTGYAQLNVGFSEWYYIFKIYRDCITSYIQKEYKNSAEEAIVVLDGLSKLTDYAMHNIAEAYIEEKNNFIEKREQQYKALIQNSSDLVAIFDLEGNCKYVSPSIMSILEFVPENFTGRNVSEFIHPKDLGKVVESLHRVVQDKKVTIEPVRFQNSNGEWRWMETDLIDMLDNEAIEGIVANSRDITERVNREEEKELLVQISKVFNSENELSNATGKLCKLISEFGKFDWVEIWIAKIQKSQMHLLSHYVAAPEDEVFYNLNESNDVFEMSEGLAGRVWVNGDEVHWCDIEHEKAFKRQDAAKVIGLKDVLGIPLTFDGQVIGVLIIGTKRDDKYLNRYIQIFKQMEIFLGLKLKRKKLENEMNHLFNAVSDVICIFDFQGRFLQINKAGCEILGCAEINVLYREFDDFVHPEEKGNFMNEFEAHKKGNSSFGFENRYIKNNGEIIWLKWCCNPDLNEGLMYATATNITEEKNLRELNRQVGRMVKIGSWEVDLQNQNVFWSDEVHLLHGTDPKLFVPSLESALSFYKEDFREIVDLKIQNCVSSGEPFSFDAIIVTSKNEECWVRSSGNAEIINGECKRVYGSIQDINSQKHLELQLINLNHLLKDQAFELQNSNKELENFAYVASHDLQEPLRVIISYLQIIENKYLDGLNERGLELMGRVVGASKRMKDLINALLEYSRIERMDGTFEKTDLNRIMEVVIEDSKVLIEEKNASIEVLGLPSIYCDREQIRSVFMNLLNNAIKYHKPNETPVIQISAESLGDNVEVTFADNGIGINPEFHERIFQIFQRLHTREEFVGTGLGLATTKKIIDNHHGKIRIESNEGQGSKFVIILPVFTS